ncbi:MAG: hypothetical protein QNK27_14965, partial [Desulfuromusa sp.]|nr:hypothetical protein [Desulfuromusa sp.]
AMKATQQNPVAARIMGIRTKRIMMLTWGISSKLNHIQVESAGHETGWDNYFCRLLQQIGGRCLSIPDS